MDDDQGSVKGTKEKAAERAREELARKETKAVRCLRLTMGSTLVVVAVSICLVVYHYTRNVEHDEFGNHYRSISVTLIDNFHSTFEQKLSAFDVLSASITRHARATNVSSQQKISLSLSSGVGHAGRTSCIRICALKTFYSSAANLPKRSYQGF